MRVLLDSFATLEIPALGRLAGQREEVSAEIIRLEELSAHLSAHFGKIQSIDFADSADLPVYIDDLFLRWVRRVPISEKEVPSDPFWFARLTPEQVSDNPWVYLVCWQTLTATRRETIIERLEWLRKCFGLLNHAVNILLRLLRTPLFRSKIVLIESSWFALHGAHPPHFQGHVHDIDLCNSGRTVLAPAY